MNVVALTLNCEYRAVGTEHQSGPGLVAGLRGHRVSRGQPRHGGRGRGLLPLLGGVLLGPAAAREEHHDHCHGGHEAVTEVRQQSRCQGDTGDITEAGASVEGPGVRCELATGALLTLSASSGWPGSLSPPLGGLRPRPSKINSSWQPPARLRHRGRRARTVTHLSVFSARCLHLLLLWGNNTGARHQHSDTALVSIEMLRGSSVT